MRRKKAQQLVEFMLVAPFIIIFLGIFTEYAYALNVNMTLNKGLKTVTSTIYTEIKPSMSITEINNIAWENLIEYLHENKVPTTTSNNIYTGCAISGDTAVFTAEYTYIPAFSLPNVFFKFMPDKFHFFTTSAVPAAFLGENNYDSSITTSSLDETWNTTGGFSNETDFDDSKQGVLKNVPELSDSLFLISTTAPGLTKPFALVDREGQLLKDASGNLYVYDTSGENLYSCTSLVCSNTGNTLFNYLNSNSFRKVFFVHDSSIPADLTTLSTVWVTPSGATNLSSALSGGILKRVLSMTDSTAKSLGNYDNLNVSSYNSDFALSQYSIDSLGGMVFIHEADDDIQNIVKNHSGVSYNYDFGSRL